MGQSSTCALTCIHIYPSSHYQLINRLLGQSVTNSRRQIFFPSCQLPGDHVQYCLYLFRLSARLAEGSMPWTRNPEVRDPRPWRAHKFLYSHKETVTRLLSDKLWWWCAGVIVGFSEWGRPKSRVGVVFGGAFWGVGAPKILGKI